MYSSSIRRLGGPEGTQRQEVIAQDPSGRGCNLKTFIGNQCIACDELSNMTRIRPLNLIT